MEGGREVPVSILIGVLPGVLSFGLFRAEGGRWIVLFLKCVPVAMLASGSFALDFFLSLNLNVTLRCIALCNMAPH